jgi:hypothetical protein
MLFNVSILKLGIHLGGLPLVFTIVLAAVLTETNTKKGIFDHTYSITLSYPEFFVRRMPIKV